MTRVWAIEILSHCMLYRFERDPAGLWFHHVARQAYSGATIRPALRGAKVKIQRGWSWCARR
jgi:hypothetical protein